ncbi:beta-glucosidase [Nocardia farcinica]|uniref:Exo-alpha-(1->6)-L-arabinopyranosidase n=1 Tax=Nocardia farcinica TaxID=37329 RepID=A0A0H5NWN2_NOCFR|nr:glycoside hydrolase family 3 C-terminal domain-containing protein [Nocardia farcinica]AXK89204.1 glycosyl hydrolase [Nocardia farcinica]PFX03603.1 Thermostable beta-glucosidase B [Nocardia farcinica]CRY74421.1 Thermostable beta-glucosidase B [Nocardia farcinica]SIT31819.1 beta-glucosidase [Nocardia farcinica]
MDVRDETAHAPALTLDEKIALGAGATFWTTHAAPGIRALTLTDGPSGLRDPGELGDHLGIARSRPATCFPAAGTLAASWDVDLVAEVGAAIGTEAIDQNVDVVLGPGVNMKRNPLCGRNFEYYSEDPLLSGKLAAAWIRGVQSTGTGTSLKHFALNNQETKRMTIDVRVDDRALHEYYLPAFEIAVREGDPTTVMTAYNRVEGVYCSENRRLVTEILRERWGFEGVVVTDWGAMNDRVAAYAAGVDLEMPGNGGASDAPVRAAVAAGRLPESILDASVERLRVLATRTADRVRHPSPDLYDRNHALAHRAATESGVLLKNDNALLPLRPGTPVALIGALAEQPRYQGTGSSHVQPTRLVGLRAGVADYTEVTYAAGYRIADEPDNGLLAEAVALAETAPTVIVCVGLTEIYESEGFDREHMRIPTNQIALLEALAHLADRIVLVVVGGSAMEMPWESSASAILHMQLAGQAGGSAAAALLFGAANPSGKLTESYPFHYRDVVNSGTFGTDPAQAVYLESMYCGYRYFDSAEHPVRYPFGFGLSYTSFDYSDLRVTAHGEHTFDVRVTVTNTGDRDGAEVVQLYLAPRTGGVHRPAQELRAFTKIRLAAGESQEATLRLDQRSFAHFDPAVQDWVVEAGTYEVRVAASSRDVRLTTRLDVTGAEPRRVPVSDWYHRPSGAPTPADFATVHAPFPRLLAPRRGTFDLDSTILDMKDSSLACRILYRFVERAVAQRAGLPIDYGNVRFKMLIYSSADLPIRTMARMSAGMMSPRLARFFVDSANGRTVRGLWSLLRGGPA